MRGLSTLNLTTKPAKLQRIRKNITDAIEERNKRRIAIPMDELIVVGGAALQMYGIKKTNDIDVVVTPHRMEQILEEEFRWTERGYVKGYTRPIDRRGLMLMVTGQDEGQLIRGDEYGSTYGDITYMLAPNDHLYQATFEELRDEAEEIDGVLVSPPVRILQWKLGVNRPKDADDIALIKKYLASQS